VWQVFVGSIGGGLPVQVLWATLTGVGAWVLMNRSRTGAHIYAVGDNREAARVMGINVRRTLVFIFTISGVLAALTGIMINLVNLTLWPTTGDSYLLPALASAFIGGNPLTGGSGTIFGTAIGGLILSFITLGIVASGGTGFWTQLVYGLIIVAAISAHAVVKRSKRITEVFRRPISSM
jgi:simple sugar transport system permease protein